MQLFLVQHGRCKTEDEDPDRPLTDQGAEDVASVAQDAVTRLAVQPARALHSGKARARQTAEIWGRLLGVEVQPADALAPHDDPTIWLERVRSETEDLMLVGHQPHLPRLAALLLTGAADPAIVAFRQGALVALERNDTGWLVSVVLPPPS